MCVQVDPFFVPTTEEEREEHGEEGVGGYSANVARRWVWGSACNDSGPCSRL